MKQFIRCPECGCPILSEVVYSGKIKAYYFMHKECECRGFIDTDEVELIPAISIRQPWAWLIVNGFKDLENRDTLKNFRGDVLIHASKQWDKNWSKSIVWKNNKLLDDIFDDVVISKVFDEFDCGGIIGIATFTDSITKSDSPWFIGKNAFVIENPKELPFTPCKGKLGFFYPEIL